MLAKRIVFFFLPVGFDFKNTNRLVPISAFLRLCNVSRSMAAGGRTALHVAAERGFADVAEE